MRGDFDEDEWDGDEPFMLGDCATCGKVKGICCASGDVEYCADCCEHPWSDDDEPQAAGARSPAPQGE